MTLGGWGSGGDLDARVRTAAFAYLTEQTGIHGEALPWSLLVQGFPFEGERIHLLGQQVIFKPAVLPELPLSIRTAANTYNAAPPSFLAGARPRNQKVNVTTRAPCRSSRFSFSSKGGIGAIIRYAVTASASATETP